MSQETGGESGLRPPRWNRILWLVDAAAQSLEVYRLENGRWSMLGTHVGMVTVQAEPFEALALELGALWER